LVGIAILIFFSSVFIYRLYRNKRKHNFLLAEQKEEIEIQKKAITDSINYAFRIQQSILPTEKAFKELLPQSFVFNRPKDIVSGDFYWIYETANQNFSSVNSKILLAMADCTGHGVPGAFMSIIGIQLLNEAINESHSPCSIAQFLDKKIKLDLNKMDLRQSKKDGMEMALCSFDFENNVLRFCGANRPLYRIRKSNLDIFSPQKTAIGFSEEGFKFRNIEIDLQKGDCIYLFSDGYPDQFGGEKDKKLTTKRFRDLLLSIQDEPFQNHGQLLDKFITNWSKNTSQVDDMLVIGVKV
jgi:serine phosphatase RsbU (regulator of sigma subunit)